jgi:hypothetical protein
LQNNLKQSRIAEQAEEKKNCRTVRSIPDLQNREVVVRIDLSVLLVIQSFIYNQGGRVVLGRIVVLRGSSGCLNTGSCIFHLAAARKTRVAGWCKGEKLFSFIQVGASIQLVLEHLGSCCFLLVGARETREFVLSNKLELVK